MIEKLRKIVIEKCYFSRSKVIIQPTDIMILPQSTEEMHPITEINHSIRQLVSFYNKCSRIYDHLYLIDIEEFACLSYDEYFAEIDKNFKLFAKQYEHTRALILNSEKQLEQTQDQSIKSHLNQIKSQIDQHFKYLQDDRDNLHDEFLRCRYIIPLDIYHDLSDSPLEEENIISQCAIVLRFIDSSQHHVITPQIFEKLTEATLKSRTNSSLINYGTPHASPRPVKIATTQPKTNQHNETILCWKSTRKKSDQIELISSPIKPTSDPKDNLLWTS